MVMQVHDELVFEVPRESVDPVREMVVSVMEEVVQLDVPLVVNAAIGSNWLEAH